MAPGVVLPKEDAGSQKPTSVRLSDAMLGEIEQIAAETSRSRNETIAHLLRYALDAHWKGAGRKPKK